MEVDASVASLVKTSDDAGIEFDDILPRRNDPRWNALRRIPGRIYDAEQEDPEQDPRLLNKIRIDVSSPRGESRTKAAILRIHQPGVVNDPDHILAFAGDRNELCERMISGLRAVENSRNVVDMGIGTYDFGDLHLKRPGDTTLVFHE